MTLLQLQTGIDTFAANKWAAILNKQTNYFGNNGKYWQGIELCSALPADGAVAVTDQSATSFKGLPSWVSIGIFALLGSINCSLRCDEYQTPDGQFGFVITATFIFGGVKYFKRWQNGPDTTQASGWVQVSSVP